MKAYQGTVSSGVWTAQNTETFSSAYKYDFNGNITELERYAGGTQIDDLEYFYNQVNHTTKTGLVSNRLYRVDEHAAATTGSDLQPFNYGSTFDTANATTWNYNYDPIGNLVKDTSEGIDLINWTVTGMVSEVFFNTSKTYNLAFRYDPMGNRIAKIEKPKNWVNEEEWTITWYTRDAQGNVMAVYSKPPDSLNFSATEFNIYGSARLGILTQPEALTETPSVPVAFSQTLGNKVYEFSNHLGNVLTTFSDRKIAVESTSDLGFVEYYTSEILSSTDYYPFGFEMPGRVYEGGYRYGFNGQEKVDEIAGTGNSYSAEFWQYDPRTGRRWNIDPVIKIHESPYACFANNPILFIDPNGMDSEVIVDKEKHEITVTTNFYYDKSNPDFENQLITKGKTFPEGHVFAGSTYKAEIEKIKENGWDSQTWSIKDENGVEWSVIYSINFIGLNNKEEVDKKKEEDPTANSIEYDVSLNYAGLWDPNTRTLSLGPLRRFDDDASTTNHEIGHAIGLPESFDIPGTTYYGWDCQEDPWHNAMSENEGGIMSYASNRLIQIEEVKMSVIGAIKVAKSVAEKVIRVHVHNTNSNPSIMNTQTSPE